ncbi:MAG: DUF262 domain-containing protein [Bacteroidales bacterium]|nr:DUF262 domain-containing protein [Bacteroidales bacterium]
MESSQSNCPSCTVPISTSADNSISLRNIRSLGGLRFYIPDYQRGYRWTSTQGLQMLDDFNEFIKSISRNDDGTFYCLQPVVVKPCTWTDSDGNQVSGYEVIDGQQRLTTLYLLLKALFDVDERNDKFRYPIFEIDYQTRAGSREFLKKITDEQYRDVHARDCIDFYHMRLVYNALRSALNDRDKYDDQRLATFILDSKIDLDEDDYDEQEEARDLANNARVIWYEIGQAERATSEGIFTRLNIGKIPLTNAELIKAMFLKDSNFGVVDSAAKDDVRHAQELGIDLRQHQIAEEWNQIEQRLQDDAFWYFLGGNEWPKEYDTRIELIFDLMEGWTKEVEAYHTFNGFQRRLIHASKRKGKKATRQRPAESVWKQVKDYFRELEYWYHDRILFHLIGYLIACGQTIPFIKSLAVETVTQEDGTTQERRLNKDEFLHAIKAQVREQLKGVDLSQISYTSNDNKIKNVLLLFNILSVIENERSDIKFPFDRYKQEGWDREHVASQTDKDRQEVPRDSREREAWINDMLYYFTGARAKDCRKEGGEVETDEALRNQFVLDGSQLYLERQSAEIESLEDSPEKDARRRQLRLISILIEAKRLSMIDAKKRDRDQYDQLLAQVFREMRVYFADDRLDNKDGLGNMALLNDWINRSYGNAFFAIKRMYIQDHDAAGVFIPLATKNLFMKYYSKHVDNMLTWTNNDARDYLAAIQAKLIPFLPQQ